MIMVLRVLSLLLSLVLVWSGYWVDRSAGSSASITLHHHEGKVASTHQAAGSERIQSLVGQTTQAAEEAVLDLVGLVPTDADTSPPLQLMAWPGPYATLAWLAPYLDGPQRPPRATRPYA